MLSEIENQHRVFAGRCLIKLEFAVEPLVRFTIHKTEAYEAYFQSGEGRRYVMLDIDKVLMPKGWSVMEPEALVLWVIREILPEYFHGVTCHWQLSASAS